MADDFDTRQALIAFMLDQLRALKGSPWNENDEIAYTRSVQDFKDEVIGSVIELLLNTAEVRPPPATVKRYCMEVVSPSNYPTVDQAIAEISEYRRNPPRKRIGTSWGGFDWVPVKPSWSHVLIADIVEALGGWTSVYDQSKHTRDLSFAIQREYKKAVVRRDDVQRQYFAMLEQNGIKRIEG